MRVQALSMYRCARVHNGVGALAGKTIALMFEKIESRRHFMCMANHFRPGTPLFIRVLSSRNYCVCFIRAFHV